MQANNVLLQDPYFPPFGQISPEQARAAVLAVLADNRAAIEQLLVEADGLSPGAMLRRLDAIDDRLARVWSPVSHLNAVQNTPALRVVYDELLKELSRYSTELGQHPGLYRCYRQIADSPAYAALGPAERQAVEQALRDFRLMGIELPAAQQARFKALRERQSELSNRFSNNVLDATQGWQLHLTESARLNGLPDNALAQARAAAGKKGLDGWLLTLDFPAYLAVMTYADDRALRRQVYMAYSQRASEFGPAEQDNSALMVELLQLRTEQAQLLGYENFAQLSLVKKMAEAPTQVLQFLRDLARESRPVAAREFAGLQDFARTDLGLDDLAPWDVSYASEKLRQRDYDISQEQLKPWFPAQKVIDGMFAVVHRLFGIHIAPVDSVATWHPDVQVYSISEGQAVLAYFYLDLYARDNKRGGAWMDDCRVRRLSDTGLQRPIAFLTCNFTPPLADTPSLLSFDEVTTLFHEFGHGLHHMLTRVDLGAVSGINGVPWDAVELPSQFLENWCWEPEVIGLISGHYQTGEALPQAMLDKMLAAKHFLSGMFMVRQLEFALFDFELHSQTGIETSQQVQAQLDRVRDEVAVVLPPADNRFQHSFSHIFSGGYAAGYYSYKWAEVLSADAFSLFEERGIFDADTGRRFRDTVLSCGGAEPALDLFVRFRGREPKVDALLRHSGIKA